MMERPDYKGRGTSAQPANRFTDRVLIPDSEFLEWQRQSGDLGRPDTQILHDGSRTVISKNSSPDIEFDRSLNPYRGCEHGCSYCYARPTHEFLGFSAGLDFETQIIAKPEAPALLREELSKKSWKRHHMVMSGVTDPYQPVEKEQEITRECLRVLTEFRQPVEVITKNYLIVRDVDFLSELARHQAVRVRVSITSLDPALSNVLEPRASTPSRRLEAVTRLSEAGVPVGVNASPTIPGLTDHELPEILQQAALAGAQWGHYIPLRLPGKVSDIFVDWLERNRPHHKSKVLRLVRELRGGKLNQSGFHQRFQGQGEVARRLRQLYLLGLKKAGLSESPPSLSSDSFRIPGPRQLDLFTE
jgi:DNA repair photolyase